MGENAEWKMAVCCNSVLASENVRRAQRSVKLAALPGGLFHPRFAVAMPHWPLCTLVGEQWLARILCPRALLQLLFWFGEMDGSFRTIFRRPRTCACGRARKFSNAPMRRHCGSTPTCLSAGAQTCPRPCETCRFRGDRRLPLESRSAEPCRE